MRDLQPARQDTTVHPDSKEWIPGSFDSFLEELDHLTRLCTGDRPLPLFRGHSRREWLLDSTFARSCKSAIFDLPPEEKLSPDVASSEELHFALLNLFLLKYGRIVTPHADLKQVGREHNADPWYELLKHLQQYPERDRAHLKGSNLIDWTKSCDVALYFANLNRHGDGALYVCDAYATGKTLQILTVGQVLEKMREVGNSGTPLGCPLMFHPPVQIACTRADNQEVVYFAQMDMRFDLEDQWRLREKEMREKDQIDESIVVKLILPAGTERVAADYLDAKAITDSYIFPDKQ